jgi:hypothetical protein
MPYVVTIEFATEADAEAFFRKLKAEPAQRVPGAEQITLPSGRRLVFDHHLDELLAKPSAGHADD